MVLIIRSRISLFYVEKSEKEVLKFIEQDNFLLFLRSLFSYNKGNNIKLFRF